MNFQFLARRLGSLLVLVLTAFLAADILSAVLDSRLQVPPRPLPTARTPAPAPAPAGASLEGVLPGPPAATGQPSPLAPSPGEGLAAPAAPLAMALRGTMLGGGAQLAVIELQGQVQVVRAGDSIGGFTVKEVRPSSVTLTQGGQERVLTMELSRLDSAPSGGAGAGPPVLPPAPAVPSPPVPQPVAPSPSDQLTRQDIRDFFNDPAAAARAVRVVPVSRDGQPYGIQMEFRQPQNPLATMGLQHGDILLGLNGEPVRTAEELFRAYQKLRNERNVEFQVDRGGSVQAITYEFSD
jgi:type II secretion system protein C